MEIKYQREAKEFGLYKVVKTHWGENVSELYLSNMRVL